MAQAKSNVLPMAGKLEDENTDKKPLVWWKRFLLSIGIMKKPDEPALNAPFLIVVITLAAIFMYLVSVWAEQRLDSKDQERFKQSLIQSAARRAEEKFNNEQQKRAKLLQVAKEQGFYDKIPEDLKTYDKNDYDHQLIQESNSNANKQ